MIKKIFMVVLEIFLLLCCACSSGEGESDVIDNICGQTPCYEGPFEAPWLSAYDYGLEFWDPAGGRLTNDNRVLETGHLLIYSDASEDWAKIEMGRTGENALALIMGRFQVIPEEIGIVDLYSKIEVYSMRRVSANSGTRADINGFVNWAHDTTNSWIEPDDIVRTGTHECTHTVQFRLGGAYSVVWCWFTEGLAEHLSGGVFPSVACWPEVEAFQNQANSVNPLTIRYIDDIPNYDINPGAKAELYYPLFGLAVRWLLDPDGHGKTCIDVKQMFRDIAGGTGFEEAFQTRMGISQDYFRDHFYGLMREFLPPNCD